MSRPTVDETLHDLLEVLRTWASKEGHNRLMAELTRVLDEAGPP